MWLLATLGCGGDATHACDAGTPTCESTLVVELPDPRTDFELRVADELGLDLLIVCPTEDTGVVVDAGVTITCGGGTVTLTQLTRFGDEVTVQLEEGEERVYTPRWQLGGDFCGNVCTLGSIAL